MYNGFLNRFGVCMCLWRLRHLTSSYIQERKEPSVMADVLTHHEVAGDKDKNSWRPRVVLADVLQTLQHVCAKAPSSSLLLLALSLAHSLSSSLLPSTRNGLSMALALAFSGLHCLTSSQHGCSLPFCQGRPDFRNRTSSLSLPQCRSSPTRNCS